MNKVLLLFILAPSLSFGLTSYNAATLRKLQEAVPPVSTDSNESKVTSVETKPEVPSVSSESTPNIEQSKTTNQHSVVGLSMDCCRFPMAKKPTEPYSGANVGQQAFGYRRDNGARLHAAADLYQSQYQPVYAIADGIILQDRVPFYLGTNATTIEHTGGFIVRYGEIASNSIKPLKLGKEVKAGQLIGYIKKVNSKNVYSPMLHFELFSGKVKGPLTVATTKKNKYGRRTDLINPTAYLQAWEKTIR